MKTWRQKLKLFIRISCLLMGLAVLWLGWGFWMVHGQLSLVHWVTDDGGLEINHMPGKALTHLQVNPSYSGLAERVWIKDHPGATERWIGRIEVPSPEELLKKARILVNNDSDMHSLCRFYPNATKQQQSDIESRFDAYREHGKLPDDVRICFDRIIKK